jgi:hypothetical protein
MVSLVLLRTDSPFHPTGRETDKVESICRGLHVLIERIAGNSPGETVENRRTFLKGTVVAKRANVVSTFSADIVNKFTASAVYHPFH